MLVIQENEYALQKNMHQLQKLSNNYNFNISTNIKFYKIMAVPVLLYGSETWTQTKERLEQNSSGRDETFKNS
jgi:hypothetical protein